MLWAILRQVFPILSKSKIILLPKTSFGLKWFQAFAWAPNDGPSISWAQKMQDSQKVAQALSLWNEKKLRRQLLNPEQLGQPSNFAGYQVTWNEIFQALHLSLLPHTANHSSGTFVFAMADQCESWPMEGSRCSIPSLRWRPYSICVTAKHPGTSTSAPPPHH